MPRDELPKDPLLPQLQTMWNADLMADVFRKNLRPLGKKTFEIETCRILKFRYRPAIRSIVLYELLLHKLATGEKQTIWVTGTTYPEKRAKKRYDKLLSALPEKISQMQCFPFAPVSFVSDLKMITQIFPFDRYLPTLPELMTEHPPGLMKTFLNQFGSGIWQIEKWQVEPVRYRAFICATLRYTIDAREVTTNRLASKYFYVKVLRFGGERTYDLLRRLHSRFSDGKEAFKTVNPLAYLEDLNCLILETAPGIPLEKLILDGKEGNGDVSKCAAALATLNSSHLGFPEDRPLEGPLSAARKAANFIQWAYPPLNKRIKKIIHQLEYLSETHAKRVPICPTHLDIKVDHLFVDGDQVIFIDLDAFALSDPVFDPASFLVQIAMLPAFSAVSPSRLKKILRDFKETYFSRVPKNWRNRLSMNYACAALKVALYFIQHMEPDWQTHVTRIIVRTEEILSTGYEEV